MGDANVRWIASSERVPTLAALLDDARRSHQQLARDDVRRIACRRRGPARTHAIHALHAATDVCTWKLLRRDLHLSRAETERTMVDLVVGILRGTPS